MDYTARAAQECGFSDIVLVVSAESAADIQSHVASHWPTSLAVEFVHQPPRPGTAQAVLAARELVSEPFGVSNADDLYGEGALRLLMAHFARPGATGPARPEAGDHVLVAYELVKTVLTAGPVTRGLIEVASDGGLDAIVDHSVQLRPDGRFDAAPLPGHGIAGALEAGESAARLLSGAERVSMNLWGFHPRVFDALEAALESSDPVPHGRSELLLPDVVEQFVADSTDRVHVVDTDARCIGLTHREDLRILQEELAIGASKATESPSARF